MTKLVYGFGINDAAYPVEKRTESGRVKCPFYVKWNSMIQRCYDPKFHQRQPTYIGCEVSAMWIKFSAFKSWMEQQYWQGKHLDKDLLITGNKIYSPDACVFIDPIVNTFTTDAGSSRGGCKIGVHFNLEKRKFQAYCNNPFTKKRESLGYFHLEENAHQAWRKRKHELSCQLADLQSDERVAIALINRYK